MTGEGRNAMGKLMLMGIAVFLIVAIPLELGINNLREKSRSAAEASSRFIAANAGREAAGYSRKPPPDQETHRVDLERCTAEGLGGRAHDPITGVVAGVVDGDTLKVTVDGIEMRVRLWGIDAPEMDQPMGSSARDGLAVLAPAGSLITVYPLYMDQHGRIVGNVGPGHTPSGRAANFTMVAHGLAYHYREPSAMNNSCLIEAEKLARASRLGIWGNGPEGGTRPWEHRKNRRKNGSEVPVIAY